MGWKPTWGDGGNAVGWTFEAGYEAPWDTAKTFAEIPEAYRGQALERITRNYWGSDANQILRQIVDAGIPAEQAVEKLYKEYRTNPDFANGGLTPAEIKQLAGVKETLESIAQNREWVKNDMAMKSKDDDSAFSALMGSPFGMIPAAFVGAGGLSGAGGAASSGVTTGGVGGGSAWNNALGIGGSGGSPVIPWGSAGSGVADGALSAGTAGTGATNMGWFDTTAFGGSPVTGSLPSWNLTPGESMFTPNGLADVTGSGSLSNGFGAFGNAGSTGNAAWDFALGGAPVGSGAPFAQTLGEAGSAASSWISGLPSSVQSAAQAALKAAAGGDSSAMDLLKKIGIPAAIVAGLMEKSESPLQGQLTDAAKGAVSSAGAFAGMPAVGMQPSTQKAIELANASAGAWQPYVDKASAYTDKAAGGIPSMDLSKYMNPYLDSVLTPMLRDINEASDTRREKLRSMTAMSGNDYVSTSGNRFNVSDSMLDRETLRAVSDASGKARASAFDAATGLASSDLNRYGTAGGAFNTLANTVGTQGGADFTRLGAAGELEAKPGENALTKAADTAKLYASIIPGTTSAVTATKNPSILGQAVGAFGAYNAATKPGGILAS